MSSHEAKMSPKQHRRISSAKTEKSQFVAGADEYKNESLREGSNDIYERSNLTKRQLLIWMGQKLNPGAPLYNMIMTFTIAGELSRARFQKAFQTMIDHSDAQRMVVREVEGIPRQRFVQDLLYEVDYIDFSSMAEPRAAFQVWLKQRCAIPFDLENRLFDSALIKIAKDQHVWYLCQHHLIIDGWSTSLVYRRTAEFYKRCLNGELAETPALPCFSDFVTYERAYRRSSQCKKDQAYWNEKLAEPLEPLNFYGKGLLEQVTRKERITYDLGRERSQKLKTIAIKEDAGSITMHLSLFNIFATLVFTYLYRVSGNPSLAIGAPFHNRSSAKFKETVGLLMEVCPLRIKIGEADNFTSVSKKIMREIREGLGHYQYSVGNPLQNRTYEVMLNYHNTSYSNFEELPTQPEWLHSGHGDGNESLALQVHDFERSGSFVLHFDFNCDVFDEEQRHRAIQHFVNIVDAILADMTKPIGSIDLLSEEERRCVVSEFNGTGSPVPNMTIAQLFEAQVERTPDTTAVVMGHERISYRDLNARANCLAHYLRTCGVTAETLVGIYMDRSIEMVIGLLGVLKAGGAYVPLDPAFPKERLACMLKDSAAAVVLTQQGLVNEILDPQISKIVCLDSEWPLIARKSNRNLPSTTKSDNLAYVIFTSGSTGRPKGIQIQHRALVNFLTSMRQEPGLSDRDVLLSLTTLSFDIAALEIFLPLTTGARLVLVRRETGLDGHRLMTEMTAAGATVMQATPTTWRMLIDSGWQGGGQLKILCGGEALPRVLANQLLERCGSLWNMYGPTETTIWSAVYHVEPGAGSVPIGRPIANTQLYVLDSHQQPVPIGVLGELHIGGAGLSRGYLNRTDLTAEKFIIDCFSDETGARLYKTGDLARRLSDGNIEFVGRMDNQIKIRGFRVELGEIEATLAQHPACRQVVAIVREDVPGDRRLVAYIVPDRARIPSISELRNLVRAKLPDYMMPSAFVLIDVMPLTPNRKVDRGALPPPGDRRSDSETNCVAPKTDVEATIAAIWQDVLKINNVGIHDNFFDLGGHSILLVQVHSKLHELYDCDLTVTEMFQYPTITSMAEYLSQQRSEPQSFDKAHSRAQKRAMALSQKKGQRRFI